MSEQEVQLKVDMVCDKCSTAVENILSKMEGVESFTVSLETKEVTVKTKSLTKEQILEAVKKSGRDAELV